MRHLTYTSPLEEDGFAPFGPLPERLLLIASLVVALCLAAFIAIPGGNVLFFWFWVYIAAAAAVPVLLLGALTLKLFRSIRRKTPRMVALWCMISVIMAVLVLAVSLCLTYTTYGETPVAYYTGSTGNRLIVTRRANMETLTETEESISYDYVYAAYPTVGKYFYQADVGVTMDTNKGIDLVEWSEDGMTATIYTTGYDGEEQTFFVSFSTDNDAQGE